MEDLVEQYKAQIEALQKELVRKDKIIADAKTMLKLSINLLEMCNPKSE